MNLTGFIKAYAQEFPNALALIQYLQGVNSSNVPELVEAELNVQYFTENRGPVSGQQTFITGESQVVYYDLTIGLNAKVHVNDNLFLILKSEKIFETMRIDIENFLLFGIHKQDPIKSISTLKQLGIDTEVIDEAIRLGRPMWVIGASRREANIPQVWIDKERLVVKKIHYINLAQEMVEQMEWSDYENLGDFYFPMQCELRSDPELLYRIKRQNLNLPNKLSEKVKLAIEY